MLHVDIEICMFINIQMLYLCMYVTIFLTMLIETTEALESRESSYTKQESHEEVKRSVPGQGHCMRLSNRGERDGCSEFPHQQCQSLFLLSNRWRASFMLGCVTGTKTNQPHTVGNITMCTHMLQLLAEWAFFFPWGLPLNLQVYE